MQHGIYLVYDSRSNLVFAGDSGHESEPGADSDVENDCGLNLPFAPGYDFGCDVAQCQQVLASAPDHDSGGGSLKCLFAAGSV